MNREALVDMVVMPEIYEAEFCNRLDTSTGKFANHVSMAQQPPALNI
jgi:hypothetical protein